MLAPAAAVFVIGGGLAGTLRRPDNSPDFSPRNPLEVMVALRFALVLAVVTILTRATLVVFGTQSLPVLAFVTGLGDLDAITLVARKMGVGQYFDKSADEYLHEILHVGDPKADGNVAGLTWEQLTTSAPHLNTSTLPYVPRASSSSAAFLATA